MRYFIDLVTRKLSACIKNFIFTKFVEVVKPIVLKKIKSCSFKFSLKKLPSYYIFLTIIVLIMVFFSISFALYGLFILTFIFVLKKKYKEIGVSWGVFLVSWYTLFTIFLIPFEGSISIDSSFFNLEPEIVHDLNNLKKDIVSKKTLAVFLFIFETYGNVPFVGSFCMESFLILSLVSLKLGITIWVPSIFKGVITLLKILFGDRGAQCQGEEKPTSKDSMSDLEKKYWDKYRERDFYPPTHPSSPNFDRYYYDSHLRPSNKPWENESFFKKPPLNPSSGGFDPAVCEAMHKRWPWVSRFSPVWFSTKNVDNKTYGVAKAKIPGYEVMVCGIIKKTDTKKG